MSTNIKSITFIKSDGSLLELNFKDCKLLFESLSEIFKSEQLNPKYPEPLIPTYPNPVYPNPIMPPYNPIYPSYPYVTWDDNHTCPTQLLYHHIIPTLSSNN